MGDTAAGLTLTVGDVVAGSYEITDLIGRGGMGAVWKARHLRLPGKEVAIKVLLDRGSSPESLTRFRREAEIASRLGHPNIVSVLDFNSFEDDTPYIVMEYLEGENLADVMARGPMDMPDVVDIARQLGSALSAAHREGIVHRDLKPQNVMLCPGPAGGVGQVKVLDFGISKIRGSTTVKTDTSKMLGTPQYMAPEQATGDHQLVDERSDVFALATIIYEMLTGEPLYSGTTVHEVVFKVVYSEPPELSTYAELDISRSASRAIAEAMAKQPADRLRSVTELVSRFCGEPLAEDDAEAPTSVQQAGPKFSGAATRVDIPRRKPHSVEASESRRPKGMWIGAAAALALAVGGLIAAQAMREPDRATSTREPNVPATPELDPETARKKGLEYLREGRTAKAAPLLAIAYRADPQIGTASALQLAMQAAEAYEGPVFDELGDINQVVVSRRADAIVSSHKDGTVRIWDPDTRELRQSFSRQGNAHSLAIAGTGDYVSARYDDGAFVVWDVRTGQKTLDISELDVVDGGFVIGQKHFVAVADDGRFVVWDVATGKQTLSGAHADDGDQILSDLYPSQDALATAGKRKVMLWDLESGHSEGYEVSTDDPNRRITSLELRAIQGTEGEVYIGRQNGQLSRLSIPSGWEAAIANVKEPIRYIDWNNNLHQLFFVAGNKGYVVSELKTDQLQVLPIEVAYGSYMGLDGQLVVLTPDGILALVADQPARIVATYRVGPKKPRWVSYDDTTGDAYLGTDRGVDYFRLMPPLESVEIYKDDSIAGISISPGGDRIAVRPKGRGKEPRLFDVQKRSIIAGLGHRAHAQSEGADFDPQGRYVFNDRGVWDAATGKQRCRVLLPPEMHMLPGAPGDAVFPLSAIEGATYAISYDSCDVVGMTSGRKIEDKFWIPPMGAAIVGDRMTVSYSDKKLVQYQGSAVVAEIDLELTSAVGLRATADRKYLIARVGTFLHVWDGKTLEQVSRFGKAMFMFRVLGDRVLSWTHDTVSVWNIETGATLVEIPHRVRVIQSPLVTRKTKEHTTFTRTTEVEGTVVAADISRDGRIVSLTSNYQAHLFSPTGERLYTLGLPEDASDVRFHPSGNLVIIAGGGDLWLWDVTPEDRPADTIDRILEARGLEVTP